MNPVANSNADIDLDLNKQVSELEDKVDRIQKRDKMIS